MPLSTITARQGRQSTDRPCVVRVKAPLPFSTQPARPFYHCKRGSIHRTTFLKHPVGRELGVGSDLLCLFATGRTSAPSLNTQNILSPTRPRKTPPHAKSSSSIVMYCTVWAKLELDQLGPIAGVFLTSSYQGWSSPSPASWRDIWSSIMSPSQHHTHESLRNSVHVPTCTTWKPGLRLRLSGSNP